jgi:TonB family protein
MSEGRWKVVGYGLNAKLLCIGESLSRDSISPTGDWIYFNGLGDRISIDSYIGTSDSSISRTYYPGTDLIRAEVHEAGGKQYGELLTYYRSGKLKRRQTEVDGKPQGVCYDSTGAIIPFTPYRILPEPGFDIGEFLSNNLQYPKKAIRRNIQGRVVVAFEVDRMGNLLTPQIVFAVHPLLDEEALRVVRLMPHWKPGMLDDEPFVYFYTLPISFKLDN